MATQRTPNWIFGLAILGLMATLISVTITGTAQSATPTPVPVTVPSETLQLNAWLLVPAGNHRFPAVIVAHGCNGLVGPASDWEGANRWASWLNENGYAALILDSFSARGRRSVCNHGADVPIAERAIDIISAASYLSKLSSVDPHKIAAIGFSHGGSTVLRAAADGIAADAKAALAANGGRLAVVVAMYPGCRQDVQSSFSTAILIIIGTADDWTPYMECQELANFPRPANAHVQIRLYPGATHAFDEPKGERVTRGGHHLKYDEAATSDAERQIKAFLDQSLTPDVN